MEAAHGLLREVALSPEDRGRSPLLSPSQPDPEAALWRAAVAGQASAFEELYRSHGGRMKSVARNLLGNVSDAEDAVQETFLKLYRKLPAFRGEARLSTWLYRILVNTCYDMGRQRRRKAEPAAPADEAGAPEPPAPAHDHPLRLTIERGLGRLAELPRTVFLLHEVEGFKHGEIGAILGIPEGTSKHALFAAKRELQALILASRRHES